MTIQFEERPSDSPYIESITHGYTTAEGFPVRPAETNWHMVCTRFAGSHQLRIVGPWSTSGSVYYGAGAEILWIKFRLGAYMPRRPTRSFLDSENLQPGATSQSFWLDDRTWSFPDYDNVETFIARLVRQGALDCDPVVTDALHDQPPPVAGRTVRHRFLRAAGLTHTHIRQIERAKQAAARLSAGAPILDVTFDLGYYDQPHLTRSLKQFVGYTPAQLIRLSRLAGDPA